MINSEPNIDMRDQTKPYKSRLFNFLNRQFIKINSQVSLKFRQLNYLTTTGFQTILSPVFFIWQTWQKKTNNTITGASEHELEKAKLSDYFPEYQLALPSCDQLISDLNEIIKQNNTVKKLNINQQPYLACRLDNNNLVLVDQKSQIYNLFSQTQQQELNLFIREIRADYRRNSPFPALKYKSNKKNQQAQQNQSSFSFTRNLFINRWQKIQQDLIRIKNNNLSKYNSEQKEKLTNFTKTDSNSHKPSETNQKLPSIVSIFDKLIAKIEKLNLFTPAPLVHQRNFDNQENKNISLSFNKVKKSDNFVKVKNQIKLLITETNKQTKQLINSGLNQANKLANSENIKDNPFEIKRLIWAAIDYFLSTKNEGKSLKLSQGKLGNLSITETQKLIIVDEENAEPWLSWIDLFGEEGKSPEFTEEKSYSQLIHTESVNSMTENIEEVEREITSHTQEIEAKVIEINYEKHFLEIILDKLDELILWLEEIIKKIWLRIKLYIKPKKGSNLTE